MKSKAFLCNFDVVCGTCNPAGAAGTPIKISYAEEILPISRRGEDIEPPDHNGFPPVTTAPPTGNFNENLNPTRMVDPVVAEDSGTIAVNPTVELNTAPAENCHTSRH